MKKIKLNCFSCLQNANDFSIKRDLVKVVDEFLKIIFSLLFNYSSIRIQIRLIMHFNIAKDKAYVGWLYDIHKKYQESVLPPSPQKIGLDMAVFFQPLRSQLQASVPQNFFRCLAKSQKVCKTSNIFYMLVLFYTLVCHQTFFKPKQCAVSSKRLRNNGIWYQIK